MFGWRYNITFVNNSIKVLKIWHASVQTEFVLMMQTEVTLNGSIDVTAMRVYIAVFKRSTKHTDMRPEIFTLSCKCTAGVKNCQPGRGLWATACLLPGRLFARVPWLCTFEWYGYSRQKCRHTLRQLVVLLLCMMTILIWQSFGTQKT